MNTEQNFVVQLADIGRADGASVGGKNASPGEMIGAEQLMRRAEL